LIDSLNLRGPCISLAGYGMKIKMKTGYGITGLLMVGCRIKIFRRERDLLIFADGMRNSLKLTARCGMKNGKSHVAEVTRRTGTLTRRDRDKYSDWGRMAMLSQK